MERILPDGCIEWIFHLGDSFAHLTETGEWEIQPRSFVVGELTRYLLIKPTSSLNTMGVRFRASGAYRFFPLPLHLVTDRIVPTSDIWCLEAGALEARVYGARTNNERRAFVEDFLLRAMFDSSPRVVFEAAASRILQTRGQQRIKDLAEGLGWSTRKLEREFRVAVGLSPKAFARIARFQGLLLALGETALREWAVMAVTAGYADQPHMSREFRKFVGESPTQIDLSRIGALSRNFISAQRLSELLGPAY